MNADKRRSKPVYCSFCGRPNHEVVDMIAGPCLQFICNECVDACLLICAHCSIDARQAKQAAPWFDPTHPMNLARGDAEPFDPSTNAQGEAPRAAAPRDEVD